MEWISVDERLPEDHLPVLFVSNYDGVQVLCMGSMYVDGTWHIGEWFPDGSDDVAYVTHWMPLPSLPGAVFHVSPNSEPLTIGGVTFAYDQMTGGVVVHHGYSGGGGGGKDYIPNSV